MRALQKKKTISYHFHIDAKTLNKILENWVSQYMTYVIHQTKLRFILGTQGWFKIQELIIVIPYIKKKQIILTDTNKLFDKIQHARI